MLFCCDGTPSKNILRKFSAKRVPQPPLMTCDGREGGVGGDVDLPAIRPNSMPSCSGVNPTLSSTILKRALLQLDLSSSCKSHCFLLFLGSKVNTHMEFFSSILSSKCVEFVEPFWSQAGPFQTGFLIPVTLLIAGKQVQHRSNVLQVSIRKYSKVLFFCLHHMG